MARSIMSNVEYHRVGQSSFGVNAWPLYSGFAIVRLISSRRFGFLLRFRTTSLRHLTTEPEQILGTGRSCSTLTCRIITFLLYFRLVRPVIIYSSSSSSSTLEDDKISMSKARAFFFFEPWTTFLTIKSRPCAKHFRRASPKRPTAGTTRR